MRLAISTRLFIALTAVTLIGLSLHAGVMRYSFRQGFLDYVANKEMATVTTLADELAVLYERDRSFQAMSDTHRFRELVRRSSGPGIDGPPTGPRGRPGAGGPGPGGRPGPADRPVGGPPPQDPLALGQRVSLVAADGRLIAGAPPTSDESVAVPVIVDGDPVANVLLAPQVGLTNRLDRDFFEQQQRSMLVAGAGALLLAALVATLLARQLTRPIRLLARGARAISGGDYATRIAAQRDDELGDLAGEFNSLARTLERNRESRKRWVSDIAHELRTPLAVLRGELDALEDGVRSYDDATRRSLASEVGRLTALVGELHDLSQYDEGEVRYDVELVDIDAMLGDLLTQSGQRLDEAGIELDRSLPEQPVLVAADAPKLERVFSNLIENTLRYTDDPGRLSVSLKVDSRRALIEFHDSAPGVPNPAYPRLFERLYRVDASRSRATGGSGLGLAICKAIVEAHSGSIEASASPLGGLAIRIELPIADTEQSAQ